ncbi:copper-exporting ATPase family protein [Leptospira interrogans serovar Pomona str. UT364]|nr:copper-exporting ATPase family protein [Leptospira interrogans serovar Pomona str. UT364]
MKVQQELHLNEVTLDVIGMNCANCALRIEKGLKKIPGVKDVRVNFAMETAKVDFESSISEEILLDKIDSLGYRAVVHEDIEIDGEIQKKEFKKLKVRVIFSAFLSLPLLLSMIGHFENNLNFEYLSFLMNPWLQFVLATPIQFWIGASFYKGSFRALRNGGANMDVLVVLGTSAAYFYSVYLTFIFDEKYIHKTANLYYETSSVLITLILFGKLLEHIVKGKSSKAIQSLVNLQPKKANVIREKEIQEIPLLAVRSGDLILVKPGESIPVDGIIEEGSSTIDESMLTGESIPVEKTISNFVYGGSLRTCPKTSRCGNSHKNFALGNHSSGLRSPRNQGSDSKDCRSNFGNICSSDCFDLSNYFMCMVFLDFAFYLFSSTGKGNCCACGRLSLCFRFGDSDFGFNRVWKSGYYGNFVS